MENNINLKEILQKAVKITYEEEGVSRYFTAFEQSIINKAMLEFGTQLLELAAKNAVLTLSEDEDYDFEENFPKNLGFEYEGIYNLVTINEQSILDTIKQVE